MASVATDPGWRAIGRLMVLVLMLIATLPAVAQTGTCCTANSTPGCANAACQTFICGQDPFCCSTLWDALCASAAVANANGGGPCAGISDCPGAPPPPTGGCVNHTITITGGSFPSEVSWQLIGPGGTVASGGAPTTLTVCLVAGCYTMHMYDTFGDGWNGATFTVRVQPSNAIVATGTLNSGGYGTASIDIGGGCNTTAVTASDCADATNVCTDLSFSIDPNGFGTVNEIPPLGTVGNPDYGVFSYNPWGTFNAGCLRAGELNSTWMVINIWGGGTLEFTFGGLGTQSGFYDWIMYPYNENTCAQIPLGQVQPVRCNWNGASFGGTGLASTLPPGGSSTNFEPPLVVNAGEQYIICFSNWSSVTTSVPLQFGGTAIVDCQDVTILPVELLHFDVRPMEASALLEWTTGSEMNSLHFVIERSADLWHWHELGKVSAVGHSQQLMEYRFKDELPLAGVNYYRLTMVDIDGSLTQSNIRSLSWERLGALCHPNPSTGSFRLWRGDASTPVAVHDALGRGVQFMLTEVSDGTVVVHLRTPVSGVYFVRIGHDMDARTERVQVIGY